MTNKAEIRLEEQSEKAQSCWENLWNEIQLKGQERQKKTQEQNKKEWASLVDSCQKHKSQHPHHVQVGTQGLMARHDAKHLPRQYKAQLYQHQRFCILSAVRSHVHYTQIPNITLKIWLVTLKS